MSQLESERLDSWKEIAAYLGRDLRTVRRWEKKKGLPVHRVPGGERRTVFAYSTEIDLWLTRAKDEPNPTTEVSNTPVSLVQKDAGPRLVINSLQARPTLVWMATLTVALLILVSIIVVYLRTAHLTELPLIRLAGFRHEDDPLVPTGIEHWLRITISNQQSEDAVAGFQQQLVVDSSKYRRFEADRLTNIEFFDQYGNVLRSWLESGNSKFSSATIYWVQLPNGIPAHKSFDIYEGFAPKQKNLFNRSTTGEAAALSSRYGEVDNGSLVFPKFTDFAGDTPPAGWYVGSTPGGSGQVRIADGVFMSHEGRGGGGSFLGSDWEVDDNLPEMDLLTQQTVNGQEMILVCSAAPNRFRWLPASVGYQNMSGLEIENNNSGTPSVMAVAHPNPTQSAVIGFMGGTLYANYREVASIPQRICGGGYLAASVNSGFSASFAFDWIRLRTPPPNGVMPSATLGELK